MPSEPGGPHLSTPRFDGSVHPAYDTPRPDVVALVPVGARTILDVGCSTGALGAALVDRGCIVTGVEHDAELAGLARGRLAAVVEDDLERLVADDVTVGPPFDCVVLADVLEHLRDPWATVVWAAGHVAPGGSLVVSVPNVRHAKTFWSLLVRRRWPYDPVGIFDQTHLRFFARANVPDLVEGTGFEVVELRPTHLLTLDFSSRWNRIAHWFGDFGTLQFVFRAERPG